MIARASFVETFQELIGINWLRLRVDEGPVFNSNSVGRLIRLEQCLGRKVVHSPNILLPEAAVLKA